MTDENGSQLTAEQKEALLAQAREAMAGREVTGYDPEHVTFAEGIGTGIAYGPEGEAYVSIAMVAPELGGHAHPVVRTLDPFGALGFAIDVLRQAKNAIEIMDDNEHEGDTEQPPVPEQPSPAAIDTDE